MYPVPPDATRGVASLVLPLLVPNGERDFEGNTYAQPPFHKITRMTYLSNHIALFNFSVTI